MTIAYERFVRYQNPGTMEITVRPHNGDHLVSLQFSQAFLEGIEISRMEPEPQGRTLRGTSIVYEFPRHEGIKAAAIRLHFTFERFGRHDGRIGLVGHEPISLSQFIYP